MPTPVELVIFDLGRVMIRLVDGWKHACELVSVPYVPGFDVPDADLRKRVLHEVLRFETGQLTHEQWCDETSTLTGMPAEHIDKVLRTWILDPFPGYDDFLDELHNKGYKTACLSNTNATHWHMMIEKPGRQLLPLKRMHWQFASHLIRAAKPDAAIYEHVERVTGVQPARIVFFDDLADNVTGAAARGWHAVRIEPDPDPVTQARSALRKLGAL
jgi:glucose-1-phosphatase